MTNKQTIDGVPRHWAEIEAAVRGAFEDGKKDYNGCMCERLRELRALLDKPCVNVIDLDALDWQSVKEAATESKWMPPEYMRNEWVSDICEFLRTGPATQPQGEVEQLRELVKAYMNAEAEKGIELVKLRAQLDERDALLRKAQAFVESWDDDSQEWMDLSSGISNAITSAEPKLVAVGRYIEPGPAYKGAERMTAIRSYEEYSEQSVKDTNGYWLEGEKVYQVKT